MPIAQLRNGFLQSNKFLCLQSTRGFIPVILFLLAISPFYYDHFFISNPWTSANRNRVSAQQILETYDPILNKHLLKQRLRESCKPSLPSQNEIAIMKKRFPHLSRAVYYYNVHSFLQNYTKSVLPRQPLQALGVGGSFAILDLFQDKINVTTTTARHVDVHRTYYPANKFDIVAADQVIEHVHFPQLVMLEIHRILKPGGIAIITTVAYNPIHGVGAFYDHWRYMPDGLRTLSLPFKRGVLQCGAWGTGKAIGIRARLNSPRDEEEFSQIYDEEITRNEEKNPFTTWIIVQK